MLVNLGTPEAPERTFVKRYLKQFLSDRRVVDWPHLIWQPILNCMILPIRSGASTRLYKSIWTAEGSPLAVSTKKLSTNIKQSWPNDVDFAMRYGDPALIPTIEKNITKSSDGIVVVPLFPQYSRSTTESVIDVIETFSKNHPKIPIRVLEHYFENKNWIDLIAEPLKKCDSHVLFSCHGLPQRYVDEGDPYHDQCVMSAHRVAQAAGVTDWSLSFQSRFGPEQWLEPSTIDALVKLGRQNRPVTVVPLSFSCDCLETLEELAITARKTYEAAGGDDFTLQPCLNDSPEWARCLAQLAASA